MVTVAWLATKGAVVPPTHNQVERLIGEVPERCKN